jgi:hypothetical protein
MRVASNLTISSKVRSLVQRYCEKGLKNEPLNEKHWKYVSTLLRNDRIVGGETDKLIN